MSDVRGLRRIWTWPERLLYWCYNFFLGPFLAKLPDGTVQGSMTRWAVCLFTVAEVVRLAPIWVHTPGGWVVTMVPLGWPDVAAVFVILFALPIDAALSAAKPTEVLGLLSKVVPGGAATQSVTAPDGSVMTQTTGQPLPAPPVVPAAAISTDDPPHEWADGDPHAGLG